MLNTTQKLNPGVFSESIEQAPIRKGFGEGLVLAADAHKEVVGLCADLTESTQMHLFKAKYPERFLEMGISEQNMASVASGMAAMGKIPFITSYAMFSPGRNWEQIRTTICYNNVPVKIIGSHAGISVGPDGGTHQAIEDIAITRVIPRMVVIAPCDIHEARKATVAVSKTPDPTYLRLSKQNTPVISTLATPFEIGKGAIFFKSARAIDVAILSTGALTYQALMAAKQLDTEGVGVIVAHFATIKPLDTKLIDQLVHEAKALVTVEEHQVAGGFGSAISEYVTQHKPVPIDFIGIRDVFGQSGIPEELLKEYNIDTANIIQAAKKVKVRK